MIAAMRRYSTAVIAGIIFIFAQKLSAKHVREGRQVGGRPATIVNDPIHPPPIISPPAPLTAVHSFPDQQFRHQQIVRDFEIRGQTAHPTYQGRPLAYRPTYPPAPPPYHKTTSRSYQPQHPVVYTAPPKPFYPAPSPVPGYHHYPAVTIAPSYGYQQEQPSYTGKVETHVCPITGRTVSTGYLQPVPPTCPIMALLSSSKKATPYRRRVKRSAIGYSGGGASISYQPEPPRHVCPLVQHFMETHGKTYTKQPEYRPPPVIHTNQYSSGLQPVHGYSVISPPPALYGSPPAPPPAPTYSHPPAPPPAYTPAPPPTYTTPPGPPPVYTPAPPTTYTQPPAPPPVYTPAPPPTYTQPPGPPPVYTPAPPPTYTQPPGPPPVYTPAPPPTYTQPPAPPPIYTPAPPPIYTPAPVYTPPTHRPVYTPPSKPSYSRSDPFGPLLRPTTVRGVNYPQPGPGISSYKPITESYEVNTWCTTICCPGCSTPAAQIAMCQSKCPNYKPPVPSPVPYHTHPPPVITSGYNVDRTPSSYSSSKPSRYTGGAGGTASGGYGGGVTRRPSYGTYETFPPDYFSTPPPQPPPGTPPPYQPTFPSKYSTFAPRSSSTVPYRPVTFRPKYTFRPSTNSYQPLKPPTPPPQPSPGYQNVWEDSRTVFEIPGPFLGGKKFGASFRQPSNTYKISTAKFVGFAKRRSARQ